MYLLGKRPGPQVDVRLREVSALEDVRFKEVLLYAHRPDHPTEMNNMCLADFATMYVHHKAYEPEIESDDIRNYVADVSSIDI